jgi:ABC-type Fe3+ transport system substrate-binding protein
MEYNNLTSDTQSAISKSTVMNVLNLPIREIAKKHPLIIKALNGFGLQDITKPDIIEKLGAVLQLKTLLQHRRISINQLISRYETMVVNDNNHKEYNEDTNLLKGKPTFLALLPCGLKAGLDCAIQDFSEKCSIQGKPFTYRIEANVNHELSFYSFIDDIQSESELPDIILSSDYNSFVHHKFINKFVTQGLYSNVQPLVHSIVSRIGFSDPRNCFTMFGANILVLVKVKKNNGDFTTPVSWIDLLDTKYRKTLVIRGQDNFFCSAVLLPFYQLAGKTGISKLAETVVQGMHPAQMVKAIDSAKTDIADFYIMPLFFAKKIKRMDQVEIIIPDEGAFVSPVTMLVKKTALEKSFFISDYLLSKEIQQYCADNYFAPVNPDVSFSFSHENKLYWLGWDFIYNNDLEKIKNDISNQFTSEFMKSRGGNCR